MTFSEATSICVVYLMIILVQGMERQYPPNDMCTPNSPREEILANPLATNSCRESIAEGIAKRHPDTMKTTPELLKAYGYAFKTYKVTTQDNYILTVYRILGPEIDYQIESEDHQQQERKPSVLLQHGLFLASDCWFFQPGTRNLPFKLIEAGYDVWLGNARGTTYSMDHRYYDHRYNLEYWDFSWHEMGMCDIPAVITKILEVTKNEKIFYVGHSMGTTQYFVAVSEIPELNNKIRAGFMLAPTAYIGHMSHPLRTLVPLVSRHEVYKILLFALHGTIQRETQIRKYFGRSPQDLCDETAVNCGLCDNIAYAIFGYNPRQTNKSEIPRLLSKLSNTAPVKVFAHYAQSVEHCTFKKYDYGNTMNMEIYGSSIPPDYKLGNITVPTYLYYSERDDFAPPNDVMITANKFRPRVRTVQRVGDKFFNHIDFITAVDADKIVYDKILREMNRYLDSK